ncbi:MULTISPECIES: beta-propeller fold lactonase family protein [Pseudomonas]|uniref:Dystroglycan-type cadherin-like domain-containing protein n=1 Tax=Pseudomonas fulva TaxID=47880 RepID=A0A0D0L8E9_9PSED|nr:MULTISPECIES: beta-propeller fold lactonase family protein [Pseudomonas]KIQ06321.1 hypothetical protein RU08_00990 [Pseudomonas fulva]
MTTRKHSQRYFRALALEPRILLDAAAVATAADVAAQVDATAEAPGVKATPQNSVITITGSTDSFPPVDLFKNVDVTLAADNEEVKELVVTLDTSGANQGLHVDGQLLALENQSGFTNANGYRYTVEVSGATTTIRLNFEGTSSAVTPEQIETLIDSLQYQARDTTVEAGDRHITLQSLSDTGESTRLDISATVTLDNRINAAPVLVNDQSLTPRESFSPEQLGIGGATEVVYSSDGKYAYVAGSGAITSFSVDSSGRLTLVATLTVEGMNTATEMVISADGRSIYLIDTLGAGQFEYNPDYIYVLNVNGGAIEHAATVNSSNGGTTGGLALSQDGSYLYVGTSSNDVAIFSRDVATGGITLLARAEGEGGSNSRNGSITVSGNHVYVIYSGTAHVLISYQRNDNGTLTKVASLNSSAAGFAAVDYSLTVSQDGRYLYIAHPGNGTIDVYATGNELSLVATQSLPRVSDIALNSDGSLLYASSRDGGVMVYKVAANGTLNLLSSIATQTDIRDIALSADGRSVLVSASEGVTRYSAVQTLNIGEATKVASGITLKDSNFDALANGNGNYNGANFTLAASVSSGSFGFANENGLALSGTSISLNGNVIATFSVAGDGKLTVRFTGDTSKAVANQILHQVTYSSAASLTAGSFVSLTLQGSDGLLASNTEVLQLWANSAPRGNADGYRPPKATSETAYEITLPAGLFTDADGGKLTWQISGLPAGLHFSPLTRTLSGSTTQTGTHTLTLIATDSDGKSAELALVLEVEQIANRAPVVSADAITALPSVVVGTAGYSQELPAELFGDADALYSDSTLTWSVSGLPAGLSFDPATRTLSGAPSAVNDYALVVTVTDEHGASAQHTVVLRVISQAEADNRPPSVSPGTSGLIHTSDGRINGYNASVYSIEISDDGRTVIVLGNDSTQHALNPTGNSTLTVYSRDPATGALTQLQRFVQGASNDGNNGNGIEVDGLRVSASAAYSADGKYLYLVGQKEGQTGYVLSKFTVNADGTLSATGESVTLGNAQVKYLATSADGHIYAVAGNTLYAYAIGADGTLGTAETFTDQTFGGTGYAIAIDAQSRVFVTGTNSLVIYERNADGQLVRVASHTGNIGNFVRTIAVSDDGYVYISTGSPGSILTFHYDTRAKTLTTPSALSASQVWGLQLSDDGKTLYAGNNTGALHIYSIGSDGKPTLVKTVGYNGANGDYRALRIAIAPDGSSVYVGSFYNFKGLGHIAVEDAISVPYTEKQTTTPASGLTLSDTEFDAQANGTGNYNGATLTLQREGRANTDDSFGLSASNGLSLVGEEVRLDGQKIASLSNVDGKLTIVFTADVSTATANAVLRQITYTNASADPGASIRLTLGVKDQFTSGTDSITLALAVTQINDAPQASATPRPNLSQDAGRAAVTLFSGAAITTTEQGQLINGLTFTVSGLKDGANETLRIDGSSIALVAGSGTTRGGHAWTVTLDATTGAATVTLSSAAGLTGAQASALVSGLGYANLDKATGTTGERTVTLTSIKDNGGSANGGQDTAQLQISNTLQVTVNQSPTLGAEVGAGEVAKIISSSDYPSPYDGTKSVIQVGDKVYVVRTTTVWNSDALADVPISTLHVFQRGADGTLQLLSSLDSNDQNGLLSASGLGVSADGTTLYAITDKGIALFARDSETGALTALGAIGADLGLVNDLYISENTAYVSSSSGVTVLQRGADGWVAGSTFAPPGDSSFTDLQMSADGSFLYVATTGGNTLLSVFRVGSDGALTRGPDVQGNGQEHYVSRLALSADGRSLYLIDNDESLRSLSISASGELTLSGNVVDVQRPIKQLLVSPDSQFLVVVGGKQVTLHARASDGSLGAARALTRLADNGTELRGANFSTDGTQLYVTGSFSWNEGLLVLDLKPASVSYVEAADASVLLPDASYSAALTAGASIVIERTGGAQGTDRFTFLEDNALRLVNGQILNGTTVIADFVQANGTLTLTFTREATQTQAENILSQIAYDNLSGEPAKQMSFSVSINEGGVSSAQTATLNQVVALLPGGTLSDPQLDALNNGAGNYKGSSIVISRDGQANADDVFDFLDGSGLQFRNGAIWLGNMSLATLASANGTLTVTFTSDVSRADAQNVLRGIAYRNASDDPTAGGSKATFNLTFNDGSGFSDERTLEVNLVGVNDTAIIDTTALTPTFNAEGERVPLFENTTIDTVEAGQNIHRVIVTITGVTAGDVLGVDGGRVDLARSIDGSVFVGRSAIQYMVSYNAGTGTTTVTLYVARSAAATTEVIDSLSYGHTGNESSGQRNISLSIVESVADWRENDTTVVQRSAVVNLTAATEPNTPPTLGGISGSVPYTEQQEPVLIAPGASIGDTQLDRFNGGAGNYDGATLTITLGDGKSSADSLGFKAGNGLTLAGNALQKDGKVIGSVTVADGVMTITFTDAHSAIPTTADVQNTLRQVTYANSSDAPPARVEVSIKLADQRGLASTAQDLNIAITAVNDAPAINDDPILSLGDLERLQDLTNIPGLSTPTTSVVSSDGSRVYVADSQGNIALFSRNTETGELTHVQTLPGQQEVVSLQLSADGNSLYVLKVDGNANTIAWFTIGTDGTLQVQGSFSESLWNIKGLALSDDGKNLYLIHTTNLYVYNRDPVTGAISLATTLEGSMTSAPYLWDPQEIVVRGELVFVVTHPSNGSTLLVYKRDANGGLSSLGHIHSGETDATGKTITLDRVQHIAVSADGRTIIIANSRTTTTEGGGGDGTPVTTIIHDHPQQIDAFRLDPATGALTHQGTLNDTPTVEDIAVSSDGKALFVIRADGSVAYYSAITLEKLDSSQNGLQGASHISVSADGGVIVTGSKLLVLNAPAVPGPTVEVNGAPVVLFPALTLNDAELDAANDYQGASVTISGQSGDQFGFLNNGTYHLDGERIVRGDVDVATLTQNGNRAVLSFGVGVTRSEATALLRQVTYTSTSAVPGSHAVSIVLNDGVVDSQARSVDVTLLAPNQAPLINDAHRDYALNQAKAGQAYSITLPANLFSDPEGDSLTWAVTGLPAGLSFNPTTHIISGNTTVMGEHSVVVTARDPSGGAVSLELTLNVSNSAPVAGSDYSLDRTAPGESYSVTLPQNLFSDANDSELTWELELPEWLSYDAATRTLSGTAPDVAGNHSITITATDPHGATVSRTLTLAVALPPVQDTGEAALPELNTGFAQQANTAPTASFGGQALNAPLFGASDVPADTPAEAPTSAQPAPTVQSLLRSSGNGLADGRGSLSQQLANADTVLTDTGHQNSAGSFSVEGSRLSASVDLSSGGARSITLELPGELPDGSAPQRITLANGLPLPSWASFDARSGELRIDRERLQRDGVLRLTLISRDVEGREQRTPMDIRAEGAAAQSTSEALQQPAPAAESLPERIRQDTSSALLSEALELLEQLSDLAGEPVAVTTRHIA